MEKRLSKIVGIKKDEFDKFIVNGDIHLTEARLIPTYKPGDEMALTSVLLTAIRLIKEFRKIVLSASNIISSGKIYIYTEVEFTKHKDLGRPDGLLIVVKGGTIKDAALFEMKNGNEPLASEQIERYLQLAKEYSIPKMITVSNQFVTEPTQSPLNMKATKGIEVLHFSWSYLLTIAHVLLFKNDNNIEDEDQVEIMHEVVKYFEDKKSGVLGFHQMKPKWKDIVEKISSGTNLKSDDKDVCDAVISWQQEEKDIALILSRHLGVLVDSGEKKYKGNLSKRWDDDKNSLIKDKTLSSVLRVKDAVSDIRIISQIEKRTLEMLVSLKAPQDKTSKGQIGWLRRQLENCNKRNPDLFDKFKDKIHIDVRVKNSRNLVRMNMLNVDDIHGEINGKDIVEFNIIYINYLGKRFASPKKFVELIEQMIIEFYSGIVQHLTKWEPSAPKMAQPVTIDPPTTFTPSMQENINPPSTQESDNTVTGGNIEESPEIPENESSEGTDVSRDAEEI